MSITSWRLPFNDPDAAIALSYGDVFRQTEREYSRWNFDVADTRVLLRHFEDAEAAVGEILSRPATDPKTGPPRDRDVHPAYDTPIKATNPSIHPPARGVDPPPPAAKPGSGPARARAACIPAPRPRARNRACWERRADGLYCGHVRLLIGLGEFYMPSTSGWTPRLRMCNSRASFRGMSEPVAHENYRGIDADSSPPCATARASISLCR